MCLLWLRLVFERCVSPVCSFVLLVRRALPKVALESATLKQNVGMVSTAALLSCVTCRAKHSIVSLACTRQACVFVVGTHANDFPILVVHGDETMIHKTTKRERKNDKHVL